jgi:hypothetical protein
MKVVGCTATLGYFKQKYTATFEAESTPHSLHYLGHTLCILLSLRYIPRSYVYYQKFLVAERGGTMTPTTRSKIQSRQLSGTGLKQNKKASKTRINPNSKAVKVEMESAAGLCAPPSNSLPPSKSSSKVGAKRTTKKPDRSASRQTKTQKTIEDNYSRRERKLLKDESVKEEDPKAQVKMEEAEDEKPKKRKRVKDEKITARYSKRQKRHTREDSSDGEAPYKIKFNPISQEPGAWLLCAKRNIWIGPSHPLF